MSSGLNYFNAVRTGNFVLLNWKIASPAEIQYFEVEKRNAANSWNSISTVNGNDATREYFATDNDPQQGYNYYRLKITGKNNAVSYSEIKRVYIRQANTEFEIYPNPAISKITISRNNSLPEQLKITDITGRIILQQTITSGSAEINLPTIAKGIYLVIIDTVVKKLEIR